VRLQEYLEAVNLEAVVLKGSTMGAEAVCIG
jgi:hypothetical protein